MHDVLKGNLSFGPLSSVRRDFLLVFGAFHQRILWYPAALVHLLLLPVCVYASTAREL